MTDTIIRRTTPSLEMARQYNTLVWIRMKKDGDRRRAAHLRRREGP